MSCRFSSSIGNKGLSVVVVAMSVFYICPFDLLSLSYLSTLDTKRQKNVLFVFFSSSFFLHPHIYTICDENGWIEASRFGGEEGGRSESFLLLLLSMSAKPDTTALHFWCSSLAVALSMFLCSSFSPFSRHSFGLYNAMHSLLSLPSSSFRWLSRTSRLDRRKTPLLLPVARRECRQLHACYTGPVYYPCRLLRRRHHSHHSLSLLFQPFPSFSHCSFFPPWGDWTGSSSFTRSPLSISHNLQLIRRRQNVLFLTPFFSSCHSLTFSLHTYQVVNDFQVISSVLLVLLQHLTLWDRRNRYHEGVTRIAPTYSNGKKERKSATKQTESRKALLIVIIIIAFTDGKSW